MQRSYLRSVSRGVEWREISWPTDELLTGSTRAIIIAKVPFRQLIQIGATRILYINTVLMVIGFVNIVRIGLHLSLRNHGYQRERRQIIRRRQFFALAGSTAWMPAPTHRKSRSNPFHF